MVTSAEWLKYQQSKDRNHIGWVGFPLSVGCHLQSVPIVQPVTGSKHGVSSFDCSRVCSVTSNKSRNAEDTTFAFFPTIHGSCRYNTPRYGVRGHDGPRIILAAVMRSILAGDVNKYKHTHRLLERERSLPLVVNRSRQRHRTVIRYCIFA